MIADGLRTQGKGEVIQKCCFHEKSITLHIESICDHFGDLEIKIWRWQTTVISIAPPPLQSDRWRITEVS